MAVNDGSLEECYRYNEQVLVRDTTSGSAYCNDGTSASYSDMIAYAKANWSASVWTFDSRLPKLV